MKYFENAFNKDFSVKLVSFIVMVIQWCEEAAILRHGNEAMLSGYRYEHGIGTSQMAYKIFLRATHLDIALVYKNGKSMKIIAKELLNYSRTK
ncbi:hypothetical protein RCL_jg4021.t1 [Rhizophagus clarus]|uniref:Uncharacterized protein n=1 Tax=Rhizophagus clarus TaxID=94130 RepID=A0A8H3QDW5_9GLOM|nr:hypothetical protein RCL_jg4021.t1 [Rhizophagus clarus]